MNDFFFFLKKSQYLTVVYTHDPLKNWDYSVHRLWRTRGTSTSGNYFKWFHFISLCLILGIEPKFLYMLDKLSPTPHPHFPPSLTPSLSLPPSHLQITCRNVPSISPLPPPLPATSLHSPLQTFSVKKNLEAADWEVGVCQRQISSARKRSEHSPVNHSYPFPSFLN